MHVHEVFTHGVNSYTTHACMYMCCTYAYMQCACVCVCACVCMCVCACVYACVCVVCVHVCVHVCVVCACVCVHVYMCVCACVCVCMCVCICTCVCVCMCVCVHVCVHVCVCACTLAEGRIIVLCRSPANKSEGGGGGHPSSDTHPRVHYILNFFLCILNLSLLHTTQHTHCLEEACLNETTDRHMPQ